MGKRPSWRRWILTALLFVTVCGFVGASFAQDGSASVNGVVNDWEGKPLPGVLVKLINYASGKAYGGTTGPDGTYKVTGLPPGEYRLVGSLDAHADYDVSLTFSDGETIRHDFTIYPGEIAAEITVTAAKGQRAVSELPLVVSVLTSRDIENRRPASPQEAYENVPNMRMVGQDMHRARPNLRGLSGSRVLILLDGERMNNSRMTAGQDGISPSMIDTAQIDSIEVIGGASSALYGTDAIGGTINIVTKAPYRPTEGTHQRARFDFDYRFGEELMKPSVSYEFGQQKWAMRASYSYFDTNTWESGRENITPLQIKPLADFSLDVAETLGVASTYARNFAFYNQQAGENIPWGEGSGFNAQADLWFFPTEDQQIRFRYLTSQHEDLELAFRGPPTDIRYQNNKYRDFNKFSLAYDATWLFDWLPKFSLGAYSQTYERAAEQEDYQIEQGSSWDIGDTDGDGSMDDYFFTGNISDFSRTGFYRIGVMEIEQTGINMQAQFEPWKNAILTTGLNYLNEEATDRGITQIRDESGEVSFEEVAISIPNTEYEDKGLFAQLEWKIVPWLRLSAGARADNWETIASPTEGWLEGTVGNTVAAYESFIRANPQGLDVAGLEQIFAGAGSEALTTDNDVTTSNIGLTFMLPGGFNPYIRWADSYREPDMSARYLARAFVQSPSILVAVIPNTALEPEEGDNFDVGVKVNRGRWQAQAGYFKNELTNFLSFGFGQFVNFGPRPEGVPPIALLYHQRNLTEAEIEGYEVLFESVLPLGRAGSLTPSVSLSWIKGTNLDPDPTDLAVVEEYFGRDDTFISFEGSANDVPLGGLVPFQGSLNLRYTALSGDWWMEWAIKHVGTIDRVDPGTFTDAEVGQYGPLQSLYGYTRHSLRAGFRLKNHPLRFAFGIENLFDELYFDPFQLAPARGRTFTFGMTYDWRND